MKEYRNPIRVSATDPICSASALGNTIIGILFDKKGSDIQQAIKARTVVIDKKIDEYQGNLSKIDKFVAEKKVVLKELDDFYRDQADKKTALVKPYQDSMNDLRKNFNDKTGEICRKMDEATLSFDKDTEKLIGKKAVDFEKSFDDFKGIFTDVNNFLEKEEEIGSEPVRGIEYVRAKGVRGSSGPSGAAGSTTTDNDNVQVYNSFVAPDTFTGQVYTPTKEDEAAARLNTLRTLLSNYAKHVDILKNSILKLEEEKRRLNLISDNINPDREYKLDLNKLSAFGFEEVEVK